MGIDLQSVPIQISYFTVYFLLLVERDCEPEVLGKKKFLAKRKRVFTTKFAILPNACWQMFFYFSFVILFSTNSNDFSASISISGIIP